MPATGDGEGEGGTGGSPQWRCPACRSELAREPELLRCTKCGNTYAVHDDVPDFFKADERSAAPG